jgi:hypothetical protein
MVSLRPYLIRAKVSIEYDIVIHPRIPHPSRPPNHLARTQALQITLLYAADWHNSIGAHIENAGSLGIPIPVGVDDAAVSKLCQCLAQVSESDTTIISDFDGVLPPPHVPHAAPHMLHWWLTDVHPVQRCDQSVHYTDKVTSVVHWL